METIGHYRIIKTLGQGGMGIVYQGKDDTLERLVAIKCIKPEIAAADSDSGRQLHKEAKTLAKLNHPNIVQLYGLIDDGNHLAVVMEYINGTNLRNLMREQLLSTKQRMRLLVQVATGLAAAHAEGVVHRDLKPENILVDHRLNAKLTDFGIAKDFNVDETTATEIGAVKGTYSAMSPEQLRGEKVDYRCDLFALGLLICRVIAGQSPFGEANTLAMMTQAVLHDSPRRLDTLLKSIPTTLADLVEHLLHKDPEHRPQDTAWVAQQLNTIYDDMEDAREEYSETIRISDYLPKTEAHKIHAKPKTRHKPLTSITLFFLTLSILITGSVFYWLGKPEITHYVAIKFPEFRGSDETNQYDMVANAIYNSLESSVINAKNLQYVHFESDQTLSAKQIANISGATDVISAEIQCRENICSVFLKRLKGDTGEIIAKRNWNTFIDDLIEVNQSVNFNFQLTFDIDLSKDQNLENIGSTTYGDYLKLKRAYDTKQAPLSQLFQDTQTLLDSAPAFEQLATLHINIALDLNYYESKDIDFKALINLLNKVSSDEKVEHWIQLSEIQLAANDYDAAKHSIDTAISIDGYSSEIYKTLSHYYSTKGDHKQALAQLQKAERLHQDLDLYKTYAVEAMKAARYPLAKTKVAQGLAIQPSNLVLLALDADIDLLSGNIFSAIAQYKRILEMYPEDFRALENLANAYLLTNNPQESLNYFQAMKALSPSSPELTFYIADAYNLMGEHALAKAQYEAYLDELSNKVNESTFEAQALAHLNRFDEATMVIDRELSTGRNLVMVQYSQALVSIKAMEKHASHSAFKKSVENGLSAIWFNLPWFTPLCTFDNFKTSLASLGTTSICQ